MKKNSDTSKEYEKSRKPGIEFTVPNIIKYMGSKKPILEFVTTAIDDITESESWVCDLFSGSCSVSGALKRSYNFISNDIQSYSEILAHTYFSDLGEYKFGETVEEIKSKAAEHVLKLSSNLKHLLFDYSLVDNIEEYQRVELAQRSLYKEHHFTSSYHLFAKYYSGTYWSFEQCIWIDSLRKLADDFKGSSIYFAILSSLMHAMSYTTQSTGHFAQYRDGNSDEAVENIIIYRQKNVFDIFSKKLDELIKNLRNSLKELKTTTQNFKECLEMIPFGSTVYADPPYAPVHYSRFYHALETLIKYDYPEISHKGRYRIDRHQSPFSQKSNALKAFEAMFKGIIDKRSQMVLSYSNSGVIDIKSLISLAHDTFEMHNYIVTERTLDHKHSTMGRFEDGDREVIEYLIIAKLIK